MFHFVTSPNKESLEYLTYEIFYSFVPQNPLVLIFKKVSEILSQTWVNWKPIFLVDTNIFDQLK